MQKIEMESKVIFPWIVRFGPGNTYVTHTYRELGFYSIWSSPDIITKYIDLIARLVRKSLRNHMFGDKEDGS